MDPKSAPPPSSLTVRSVVVDVSKPHPGPAAATPTKAAAAAAAGVSKSAVYSFVGVAVSSVAILAALLAVYVRRPVDAAAGAAVRTFHIAVVSLASRPPDTPAS